MGGIEMGEALPGFATIEVRGYEVQHWPDRTRLPLHSARSAVGAVMGYQDRYENGDRRFTQGVRVKDAAPVWLPIDGANYLLVTEGPTDALEVASRYPQFASYAVAGCWSATSLPPRVWWDRVLPKFYGRVLVAGDGDEAGSKFNKRVANITGGAYEVPIPYGVDLRDLILKDGPESVLGRFKRALTRRPLQPSTYVPQALSERHSGPEGDIVRLVEASHARYGHKISGGQHMYYCPFHDDSSPSLSVDPNTGSWHCFAGCGGGGPAGYVMKWKNCSYHDAAKHIERYG